MVQRRLSLVPKYSSTTPSQKSRDSPSRTSPHRPERNSSLANSSPRLLSELRAVNPVTAAGIDLWIYALHARDVADQPNPLADLLTTFPALGAGPKRRPAKMRRLVP